MAPAYGLPSNRTRAPSASGPPPAPSGSAPSGSERAAWVEPLLRGTSWSTLLAAIAGVMILPGLLGNVGEKVVTWGERLASTLSYVSFAGLMVLVAVGGYELIRRTDLGSTRYVALSLLVLVVGLGAPAVTSPLVSIPQVLLAMSASAFALVSSVRALRAPHTRAPAGVTALLGLAGIFRVVAWATAAASLESPRGFAFARGFGTFAVVLVGLAQLVTVAYFATRGKMQGRVMGNLALVLGFLVTYIATRKPGFAGALGPVLANALLAQEPSPEPFALTPIAHFLFPTSIFLGLVAASQRRQVPQIAVALSLALVSAGRLDVPLSALAAVAGALWLSLASSDERAMWSDLLASRKLRLEEENARRDASDRPPPRKKSDAERLPSPGGSAQAKPAPEPSAEPARVSDEPAADGPARSEPEAEPSVDATPAQEPEAPKADETTSDEPSNDQPKKDG